MSVFRGSVAEYPGVIIDHFISCNCERGQAFFLSHCHKDHMTGLSSPGLYHALEGRKTNLYCSAVTHSLLLKDPEFSKLAPYLKTLPMESPVAMTIKGLSELPPLSFSVTLLPAGHCPGSAMFLFEGDNGNVLYTGDFRLTLEETRRLHPLHPNGSLMDISTLYVDTTFCHPLASKIPSRGVSRDHILRIMESWLAEDKCNVVRLHCSSFGWKIEAYSDLPAVASCLTTDGDSTRIHSCNYRRGAPKTGGGLPCGSSPVKGKSRVLHIKPSTIWFLSTSQSLSKPSVFLPQYNSYRVLHSMHASYSEVSEFVLYLRPRRVVPCVVPVGDASLVDVHGRLKALLPHSQIVSEVVGSDISRRRRKDSEQEIIGDPLNQSSLKVFSFSHALTSAENPLLPSMISSLGTSGVSGVITAPSPQPDEEGVPPCAGVTLEQSPLDLSLDSSEQTPQENSEDTPQLSTSKGNSEDTPRGNSEDTPRGNSATPQSSLDTPQEDRRDVEILTTYPDTPEPASMKGNKAAGSQWSLENQPLKTKRKSHYNADKVYHFSQESSTTTTTTTTTRDVLISPLPKRSKMMGGYQSSRDNNISLTLDAHRDIQKGCYKEAIIMDAPSAPIDVIDLTEDDSPGKDHHILNNDHHILNKDHHHCKHSIIIIRDSSPFSMAQPHLKLKPIIIGEEQEGTSPVRSLSCSPDTQSLSPGKGELKGTSPVRSSTCSPDVLPATPGREEVDSILQRQNLMLI